MAEQRMPTPEQTEMLTRGLCRRREKHAPETLAQGSPYDAGDCDEDTFYLNAIEQRCPPYFLRRRHVVEATGILVKNPEPAKVVQLQR